MSIKLKGMTWSHPRGFDPMVATAKTWTEKANVEIEWSKRSLQDFESFPVEELARAYDLIVIDHPHVGQITAEGCLAPLDVVGRESEREELAKNTVGKSYPSYTWQGHQWAFPIDAATQVQAYRPDLIDTAPSTWDDLLELAKAGRVILPMRPPHSLMTFFTIAANLGHPCKNDGPGQFINRDAGIKTYEYLRALAAHISPDNFEMDPIQASEEMTKADSIYAVMPYAYGYANYALANFRAKPLRFCNVPAIGDNGPVGTALGGTGIAVSAFSKNADAAIDYAYWVASGSIQKTIFAQAGGQPGHAAAWEDQAVNAPVAGFYKDTRKTLEGACVRPRHNGYMIFQAAAAERFNTALQSGEDAGALIDALNKMFEESF